MPPTAEQSKKGYAKMWDECSLTKTAEAARVASDILKNKAHYIEIERKIGVPWIMVGAIHMRESSLNFRTHLHNGDSLQNYTHQVPAGRPKVGHGPPFTFEESADDALTMPGKAFDKLKGQWTVELMLFSEEGYNGWGYLSKGNSPYLWAWTNEYKGGKYTRDHYYDPSVWDTQPGCAAIMKALGDADDDAKVWLTRRAVPGSQPPPAAIKQQTRKERGAATAGGAGAVTGGTGTVVQKPDAPGAKVGITFASAFVGIIGLAVVVVAGVLLYRKSKALKERWLGA